MSGGVPDSLPWFSKTDPFRCLFTVQDAARILHKLIKQQPGTPAT